MKSIQCMERKMIIFSNRNKEHPIENMNVLEIIKNVDLEALSSSLQSIEKVLGIVSNLLDKNKEGK